MINTDLNVKFEIPKINFNLTLADKVANTQPPYEFKGDKVPYVWYNFITGKVYVDYNNSGNFNVSIYV